MLNWTRRRVSGLWTEDAAKAFPYANGEIIGASFAARALDSKALEVNHEPDTPKTGATEIFFVARIANIQALAIG